MITLITFPEDLGLGRPSRLADWTLEQRSASARAGWETRRSVLTLRHFGRMRLEELLRTCDPRIVRLYACDVAESVLHHYEDAYPGDIRPRVAILVARRYAHGLAEDRERLAAHRLSGVACEQACHDHGVKSAPHAAANAAGITCWRPARQMAHWPLFWAAQAQGRDPHGPAHKWRHADSLGAYHAAALEGLGDA